MVPKGSPTPLEEGPGSASHRKGWQGRRPGIGLRQTPIEVQDRLGLTVQSQNTELIASS